MVTVGRTSAGDRGRLRQELLEEHGWQFHQFRSIDRFSHPPREVEKFRKPTEAQLQEFQEPPAFRRPPGDRDGRPDGNLIPVVNTMEPQPATVALTRGFSAWITLCNA